MPIFERELVVPVSLDELYAWHARVGAFTRLLPPFDPVRLVSLERAPDGSTLGAGARAVVRLGPRPFGIRLEAEHTACEPPRLFVDEQGAGPFASWRHEHRFEASGSAGARLVDHIEYTLPLSPLSDLVAGRFVARALARTFRYRHAITQADLVDHAAARERLGHTRPLRVLVSGASGLVGSQLVAFLTTGGHSVVSLVRRTARGPGEIVWDPDAGELDAGAVGGFDAVVNLSGAGIADGRWTAERRQVLLESRVKSSALLARALLESGAPPSVYVQASAVGAYDDTLFERDPSAVADESAPLASGFLGELCAAWEAAAAPLAAAGVRSVFTRFGIVLSQRGGALAKMLPAFLACAGGPIGTGRQPLPWIALDDVLSAILHLISDDRAHGAFNLVAPRTPTQAEFAETLARVLRRPSFLPLPAVAVRALFGEMGETLLLRGARVEPAALDRHGFRHRLPDLESALRHLLGR